MILVAPIVVIPSDALADRMKARASRADVIKGLAELTGNRVACHASYRLDEKR